MRVPAAITAILGVLLTLAACGSGGGAEAGPCKRPATTAIANTLSVPASSLRALVVHPADGTLACRITVTTRAGAATVLADLDSSPQPFFRLERASVEASQNVLWSHESTALYPVDVQGIGLAATWFPGSDQFMTTDGVRLITVTVHWPGASSARRRGLAEAVARTYLGPTRKPHFAGNS